MRALSTVMTLASALQSDRCQDVEWVDAVLHMSVASQSSIELYHTTP